MLNYHDIQNRKQDMHLRPNLLKQTLETAITFIYPAQCKVCEEHLVLDSFAYICYSCWKKVEYIEPNWCEICGIPHTENLCDTCATKPPRYDKLRTIAAYKSTLQNAIHLFKFEKRMSLRKPLSQLIVDNIPNDLNIADYDYVLPVPIHKKRLRERGFNQSMLLLQGIAKVKGINILSNIIVRSKNTSPQSSLDREARQTNIIGAFDLKNKDTIRSKKILVFDDVYTTGATIREVVNVLWDADPIEIDVLTLARTINPY